LATPHQRIKRDYHEPTPVVTGAYNALKQGLRQPFMRNIFLLENGDFLALKPGLF